MTKANITCKITGLALTLAVLVVALSTFAATAFAADGGETSGFIMEGYVCDSDDSTFGTPKNGTQINGSSPISGGWSDERGSGDLHFTFPSDQTGTEMIVALANESNFIGSYPSETNLSNPQYYSFVTISPDIDPHLATFAPVRHYPAEDIANVQSAHALFGKTSIDADENSFFASMAMPAFFTQNASQDPSFLNDSIMMYADTLVEDGDACIFFKHIPAVFRFVITNEHTVASTIHSVSVTIDGEAPVASAEAECSVFSEDFFFTPTLTGGHTSITTVLDATLAPNEQYTAYALALPLSEGESLEGKTVRVVLTTAEGDHVALEVTGEDIAKANPRSESNWVGGKSYTFHVGTHCASDDSSEGCTSDKVGTCTVCGYECDHDFSGTAHDGSKKCSICGKLVRHNTMLGLGQTFTNLDNAYVTVAHSVFGLAALRRDSITVTFSGGFLTESVTLGLYNGKLVTPNGVFGEQNTIGYIGGQIVDDQLYFRYAFPRASEEHPTGETVTIQYTIRFADEDGNEQEVSGSFTLQYINYGMHVEQTEYGSTLNLTFCSTQGNVITTNVYNSGTYTVSIVDYYGGVSDYSYTIEFARDPRTQVTREDTASGTIIRLKRVDGNRLLVTFPEDAKGILVEGNGTPLVTITVTASVRFSYAYMDHNGNENVYFISVDRPTVTEQGFSLDRLGYTTVDFENSNEYALATDGVTKYRSGKVTVYLTNCVFKTTGRMVCFTFAPSGATTHTFSKEEIVLIENGNEIALTEDVTVSLGAVLVNDHVFSPATCTAAKACQYCGATEGESLGHNMSDATCTAPKTCKSCGHTEGEATGHDMTTATCTAPKTCRSCGHTEGEATGHSYDNPCDATCNTCNEARTVNEHFDGDGNSLCDHCSKELPKKGLSGGAIAGIVVGGTAAVGIGGFLLFWFVIKKRK